MSMPSYSINPYSVDRPAETLFYGRQSELNELRDGLCSPIGRSYAIIGGRRFGKTSLLKKLQRLLSLTPAESWESPVIPVYLNLLGDASSIDSVEGFFSTVLTALSQQTTSYWPDQPDHDHASPLAFKPDTFPYHVFGDWLVQQCSAHASETTAPRVVLLLDEIERILHRPWKNDLLASLRMLVYEDASYSRVFGLVTSGSTEFYQEIESRGSPLWQVLHSIHLASLFEEETLRLIHEPSSDRVPESVAAEISLLSGGHPYLTQYFMQNLWARLPRVSVDDVHDLARGFRVTERPLLSKWQLALGAVGTKVYQALVDNGAWLSAQQIRKQAGEPVMTALKSLCYHGFAIPRDRHWTHFRYTGELFRAWFIEDFLPDAQMSGNIERRHVEIQRQELDRRYNELTKRIAALDTDLEVELDSERKLVLKERRERAVTEREEVIGQLRKSERQLTS